MTRAIDQAQLNWVRGQAEYLEPQIMRTVVAARKYHQLVPIKRDIPAAAEAIVTKVRNAPKGRLQPLANMAGDQPTSSVDYREVTHKFVSFGVSYMWSEDDLESAAMAGTPLQSDTIEAAIEQVEDAKEDIVMHGRADLGWTGLLQTGSNAQPGIRTVASASNWNTANTVEILEDIQRAFTEVATHSNQTMLPDTLLLPQALQHVITKPLMNNAGITSDSLMTYLKKNNPYTAEMDRPLKIVVVPRLDAGTVIMYKQSQDVVRFLMPRELTWSPIEIVNGFNIKRYGKVKMGGLQFLRPYGICHLTGVNTG